MPNRTGTGIGFVSSSLVLFFFLFLIIWLATQKVPVWLKIIVFIIINYVNFALLKVYYKSISVLNYTAIEIYNASEKIEPFSTVFPIKNSDCWIYGHISNYLGIDNPIIILENYEASLNDFPLKWNLEKIPNLHLGDLQNVNDCFNWISVTENRPIQIDYVFILTTKKEILSDKCKEKLKEILNDFYKLEYISNDSSIKLFRKKKPMKKR